jgi:hypothetical protein
MNNIQDMLANKHDRISGKSILAAAAKLSRGCNEA